MRVILSMAAMALMGSACLGAEARPRFDFGPAGDIRVIADGSAIYFTGFGLRVIKPGWSGTLADQAAADPQGISKHAERGAVTYTMTLKGDGVSFRLRQTVARTPTSVRIGYMLTPDRDVPVETVMLQGAMPVAPHAGRTRYVVASAAINSARCPATLPENRILYGGPADWMAFSAPGVEALVIEPEGLSLQFQDDRAFNRQEFALLATAGGGNLTANRPVRFGMTLRFITREALDARERDARRNDVSGIATGDSRKLSISAVTCDRTRVRACETVEASVALAATYANPFDPNEISVDAEVITPTGRKLRAPGFFGVAMRVERTESSERLRVAGKPGFRVRYTPREVGEHRMVIVVTDRTGTVRSRAVTLTVTRGSSPGFVGVSRKTPAYFAFDSGKPFIAIGENVCWASGPSPLSMYEAWFAGLGKAGGNWARLWLAYNEKGMEWSALPTPRPGTGTYAGLGRYALDNAWRLDEIVRMAEKNGIYLMLCIGTYGEFTEGGFFNEGMWVSNPYNKANGGPCATPAEFWTDPTARKLYKQRLRYLIARYGHSPNVFAWEFWNEVPPTPEQARWVAEMAAYVKQHDPHGHLVSTTYGNEDVWKCPDIDFTMTHMYGQAGNTPVFTDQIVAHTRDHRRYGKPYLLAEFGVDWQAPDSKWDPRGTGANMHNGAWAGLLAGGAGTAMVWWWDSYVHPNNLYRVFTPVRRFADAVDWQAEPLSPVANIVVQTAPGAPETFKDLVVSGSIEWGMPASDRYTILHDGRVLGGPIAMAIGSPGRSNPLELPTKLTYVVDLERPTTVALRLGQVCTRATMVIAVNGETRLARELTAGEPGAGPWKSSRKLEQYNVWVSQYDEDIPLELPAGKHEIEVRNTGGDWFQIASITLPGYQSSRYPDVTALALSGEKTLLMWIHNRESSWRTDYDGKTPTTLEGLRVTVPVRRAGRWDVEWWNTRSGQVIRREVVETREGSLLLLPPPLERDYAVRARLAE
ncbi:MAG: DUF5060 domain-containing protein [Chthonomonadales bacterium]|nr:DUF5060 domain-containing protein [Chthonomonadales bacterium]